MIEFLKGYAAIISLGISVLGFLVLLILRIYYLITKKRSTTTAEEIEDIYVSIPQLIKDAEVLFGAHSGSTKLHYVLTEIKSMMIKCGYDLSEIESFNFESYIESVLATPEKKGD